MKNVLTIILLCLSHIFFAQISKNVVDFTKVTSFDKIEVLLVQATENKIELSGNGADQVELVNNNGELKIRMPLSKILSGENVTAKVFYKKIDAIEANEGSRIVAEHIINAIGFDVIAKEGATISLNLQAKKLSSKISSGAIVDLEGKVENHESLVNSGAILNAKKLQTSQTTVTVNAGGEVEISASDYVNAKVRAGGNILIFGRPKQIDQKTILGGSIRQN